MDLTEATALVTGANRGIGRALVEELAARPLRLVLAAARRPEQVTHPAAARRGGSAPQVRPVKLDLSSREKIEEGCRRLGPELAEVDLLINNAGLMTGGLLEDQDLGEIYSMFQVNLLAVVQLTRSVLPFMVRRGSGTIVNNASISGYAHFPAASTYAASKAGVVAFTESLRRELRGTGVHAMHLLTPGVATEMLEETEKVYGHHMNTSRWDRMPPAEWAKRVVSAIEQGRSRVGPGGRSAGAVLASHGPPMLLDAISARMFSRRPRG